MLVPEGRQQAAWRLAYAEDVATLLRAVDERDHLLHVMATDGEAYERGRLDEWRAVRAVMDSAYRQIVGRHRHWDSPLSLFIHDIENCVEWQRLEQQQRGAPPMPPAELRKENEAMLFALEKILQRAEAEEQPRVAYVDGMWTAPSEAAGWKHVSRLARAALGAAAGGEESEEKKNKEAT
jgi:hypothetical protein